MTATFNLLQDTVEKNNDLFLIFLILILLIALFVLAINIARLKNVFFKFAKTNRGRLYTYKLIKFYVKYRRFIWYVLFGFCTTAITILFKNLFHFIFNYQHPYLSAEIAWLFATIFSFFANKYFVFKSLGAPKIVVFYESVTFLGARIISLFLDFVVILLLYSVVGMDYILVSLISIALQIVSNYVIITYIVFNERVKKMFEIPDAPPVKRRRIEFFAPMVSEDGFIPTFSKDDDFLKYLADEGFN